MTIVAVFKCSMTSQTPDEAAPGELIHTAELSPVPLDPKNQALYAYTPMGTLRFMAIKSTAADFFKPGDVYEVTIAVPGK